MPAVARTAILVAGIGLAAFLEVLAGPHRTELVLPAVVVAGGFLLLAVSVPSRIEAVLAAAVATTWLLADLLPFTAFWHRAVVVHLIVQVAWRGRLPRAARILVGASYALALASPLWTRDAVAVVVGTTWSTAALTLCALAPPGFAGGGLVGRSRGGLVGRSRGGLVGRSRGGLVGRSHGRRRSGSLVAGAFFAAGLVGSAASRLVLGFDAAYGAELMYDAMLLGTALTLILAQRDPSVEQLVDVVVRLGEPGREVRDELAWALGDPGFEIAYWDRERQAYVAPTGDAGRIADPATGRRVDLDGERAALVRHGPGSIDDSLVDQAVLAALRVRREHARLEANARRRVLEVEESRRRIAVADAAERARFGRELDLRVADPLHTVAETVRDERARELLALAGEDLARLSAGLAPTALTGGLRAALHMVSAHSPAEVTLDIDRRLPPLDPATGACVYFACAEALANAVRHGDPGTIVVVLWQQGPGLVLRVRNPAASGTARANGSGLSGLRARAEALDGSLRAGSSGGVFELELLLPVPVTRS